MDMVAVDGLVRLLTIIEAARPSRGMAPESDREPEKTALLAQLRQGCFRMSSARALDAAKTNLSSWQSSVGKGRTPRRDAKFVKLG